MQENKREKIIRIKGKDTYTLLCAREIVWW